MNCIIVDDNKLARASIAHLIGQIDFLVLKNEFENSIDAFNFLKAEQVDLLFLDVELPDMSGIEFVKSLEKRPIIIFITAKKDYAVDAFELNVADYIVKPVTLPRFITAVSKAKELSESKEVKLEIQENERDFIFVRNKKVLTKIKLDDILYIQALGDFVNIFTSVQRYTIHITLSGIEKKLPAEKFYRIHRSYLAGLNHIASIEEGTAFIKNTPIPIGEHFKNSLLKKLNFI